MRRGANLFAGRFGHPALPAAHGKRQGRFPHHQRTTSPLAAACDHIRQSRNRGPEGKDRDLMPTVWPASRRASSGREMASAQSTLRSRPPGSHILTPCHAPVGPLACSQQGYTVRTWTHQPNMAWAGAGSNGAAESISDALPGAGSTHPDPPAWQGAGAPMRAPVTRLPRRRPHLPTVALWAGAFSVFSSGPRLRPN